MNKRWTPSWLWIGVGPVAAAAVVAMTLSTSSIARQPAPEDGPPGAEAASRPAGADLRVRIDDERGPREGPPERPREGGLGERQREPGPRPGPGTGAPGGHGPGDREGPRGPHGMREPGPGAGPEGPRSIEALHGPRRLPSVDTMRNYLELVDRYAAMSADANKAGVAAVITAADLLRAKGNDAAITYFNDLVSNADKPLSPEVTRAVRLQLAELYKAAGKSDEALEQLKLVIQGSK